jgi:zinc protease
MTKRTCKTVIALLALTLLLNLGTTEAGEEIKLPPMKSETLSNGLEVLVIEHHELPVVAFRLVLKTGAAFDPKGEAGLASLTADLLRKGTKTRSATEISEALDFVGGSLSTGADRDATFVTCKVLKRYFDTGLDLLADVVLNPTFAEEEIDRLKSQTTSSLMQQKDDPNVVVSWEFDRQLFGQHPFANPTEGTVNSLKSLRRDDIVAYHQSFYRPNNAILCIVGDVKPKEVLTKVEAKFSGWKKGKLPEISFSSPPPVSGYRILLVDKPDLTQSNIKFGHLGVDRSNPDYFPLVLMNYILGGSYVSRLNNVVRVEKGLTYGIWSQFEMNKERGAFVVTTFTRNDSTLNAIRASLVELKRIREQGVTKEELKEAKSFYRGYFPLRFETPEQIATRILETKIYNLGKDYLRDYRENMDKVTIEEVNGVAQKYIGPDNLVFVVVSNAEEVKSDLEKVGPVEVVPYAAIE